MRFDLLTGKYLSRFTSQGGKKGEFPRSGSSAQHLLGRQINLEITHENAGVGLTMPPPADDRFQASVHFRNGKRLRQVVICAQGEIP
jgi:hypothetical protein